VHFWLPFFALKMHPKTFKNKFTEFFQSSTVTHYLEIQKKNKANKI